MMCSRAGIAKTVSHGGSEENVPDMQEIWTVPKMGCCEGVPRFMGCEVTGRKKCRAQAVKRVVAKLQGDKTASFCRKMSGCEVAG